MFQLIFTAINNLLIFAGAITVNKGKKIDLTAEERKQRAHNNANRLERKESAIKWLAIVKFYGFALRPLQSYHAKNHVQELVASEADILWIDIQKRTIGKRTGNWLIIEYMRDDYKREYLIEAK